MLRKQNGITLIALVISVIVMLILAGVSINATIGDNGIVTQARKAVEKNRQATAVEEITMAWAGLQAQYYSDWAGNTGVTFASLVTKENLQKYVESTGTIDSADVNVEGESYYIQYTSDDQEATYLFLAEENGRVTLLDGLNITPSSMAFEIVNGTIPAGKTLKGILTNTTGTIHWESLNSSVANVSSASGEEITVTAVGAGTTTIKATCGEEEKTCTVTVTSRTAITGITLTPNTETTINKGNTTTVVATITPSDATETITWTSSNTTVATISGEGNSITVAGLSSGTSRITASSSSGGTSAYVDITVVEPVTVSFNTDGGTAVESQTVNVGSKATQPATNPTKDHYIFAGWYTDSTKTTIFDFDAAITGTTTIYAKWAPAVYNITSNITNGGTATGSATTINYGGGATVTITANDNYTLPSDVNVTGATKSYNSSTGVITLTNATGAVTITATCESAVAYFKTTNGVAYYCSGATEVPITTTTIMGAYLGRVVNYTPGNSTTNTSYGTSTTYRLFYVDINGKYGAAGTIYLKADCDVKNVNMSSHTSHTSSDSKATMYALNPGMNRGNYSDAHDYCVAWMTDPNEWSAWKDSSIKVEGTETSGINYVVGGPSLEMWVDSYNAYLDGHTSSGTVQIYKNGSTTARAEKLACEYTTNTTTYNAKGYRVGFLATQSSAWANTGYYQDSNSLFAFDSSNGQQMYNPGNSTNNSSNHYYWLASPSANSANSVMYVGGGSRVSSSNYTNGSLAFCPLVSCKSGVRIEEKN